MIEPISVDVGVARRRHRRRRRRLTLLGALALYGGALGASSVLINLLTRTKPWVEPEHMAFVPSTFISISGAVAAILLVLPIAILLGERTDEPRGLPMWLGIGAGYGVLLPFLTGAFLPLSLVFVDLSLGVIEAGDIVTEVLSGLFRTPLFMFVHGTLGLFTGLLTGVVFGAGAWAIDRLNGSPHLPASQVSPWAVAVVLGLIAVVVAVFGPSETLAKLG